MARYVRYRYNDRIRYGELRGATIQPLDGEFAAFTACAEASLPLQQVQLLAPSTPSKILSVGPNFHFEGYPRPTALMIWAHPISCINDPEGIIEIPPGHPLINHECELAIIIGRRARRVSMAAAAECIFGYTCYNDITAGDFVTPGAFMSSHYYVDGKLFDGFAPFGPSIVTDVDVSRLTMQCRVNGQVRQRDSTANLVFPPAEVVSMVSAVMTLLPGDVIACGSPPGVQPLNDGDVVEIEIESIGTLRNRVRAA
jgi:2-keto-4-pentenoate hydratase/2-oxohepta-3-ene-1,7-dioic acid hydratase in catechol pathway